MDDLDSEDDSGLSDEDEDSEDDEDEEEEEDDEQDEKDKKRKRSEVKALMLAAKTEPKKEDPKKKEKKKPQYVFVMDHDDISDEYITSGDETTTDGKNHKLYVAKAHGISHKHHGGPVFTFNQYNDDYSHMLI